jgi:hypothetical protein
MKPSLFLLTCLLSLILSGCKKSEQPAVNSASTDQTSPAQSDPPKATAAGKSESPAHGTDLKVKWPVGSRYVYRLDLESRSTNNIPQMPKPMHQDITMAMTYAVNVVKETPDNGRLLEMEFLANEMEMKMADQVVMSFDSKETSKEAQNPFVGPFKKMIGSKIQLQTDADGKVDKVLNHEEWLNEVAGDGPGPARGMLAQQFNEGYFRQIAGFGNGLPSKPVEVGDTWPFKLDVPTGQMGKLSVNSTVMLKDFENRDGHNCAVMTSVGTFKGSPGEGTPGPMGKMSIEQGKMSGTTWFDPALGALIEMASDQTMHIKGEAPGPAGGKGQAASFTSDLGQKINMKLVELKQP